jgi:hypothetical protein
MKTPEGVQKMVSVKLGEGRGYERKCFKLAYSKECYCVRNGDLKDLDGIRNAY